MILNAQTLIQRISQSYKMILVLSNRILLKKTADLNILTHHCVTETFGDKELLGHAV